MSAMAFLFSEYAQEQCAAFLRCRAECRGRCARGVVQTVCVCPPSGFHSSSQRVRKRLMADQAHAGTHDDTIPESKMCLTCAADFKNSKTDLAMLQAMSRSLRESNKLMRVLSLASPPLLLLLYTSFISLLTCWLQP